MNLQIDLPDPPPVAGAYQTIKRHRDLLFTSGHGPIKLDGSGLILGKVGTDLTLEDAQEAARITTLGILSSVKAEVEDLENVVNVMKINGMVNGAPGFQQHPAVLDACSNLLIEVFGEDIGRCPRTAVGMAELPFNMAVEIEAVFAVR
jgi:enamine deaminase RidA (YjgF/YER057c/UK114 family)